MAVGSSTRPSSSDDIGEVIQEVTSLDKKPKARKVDWERLLVYNVPELPVAAVREAVLRHTSLSEHLVSVKRCRQRDGIRRFDVIPLTRVKPTLRDLSRLEETLRARVKVGRPYTWRKEAFRRRSVESGVTEQNPSFKRVDASHEVKLMTYNVNGLRAKMLEISLLLKCTQPSIVCMQETLVKESAHRTWLPRYQTIENRAHGKGVRGMVLAVKRDIGLDLSQYYSSEWLLVGRVTGMLEGNVKLDMLVINVYIPCDNVSGRAVAKQDLSFFLREKATRNTWTHVLLAGDFNTLEGSVDRLLLQSKSGVERVPLVYNGTRWSYKGRWTNIDHLASKGFESVSRAKPLQTWDLSDHFPVVAKFKIGKIEVNKRGPTISKPKVLKAGEAFTVDPKWEAVMGSGGNLTTQAEAFIACVWEVARDCKAVVEATPPVWRVWLSKETRKLIKKRRTLFKHIKDPNFDMSVYKDLWSRVRASMKQDACVVRTKRTQKICELVTENRFKELWREISTSEGDDLSSKPIIDDTTGELIHNKVEKEKKWAQHFGDLASDHTGHSRDPEYWVDKFPIKRPVFPECDEPLSYGELRGALMATPWGKAAGIDGVSADILKVIAKEEEPVTPAAKALWVTVKSLWDAAMIPRGLNVGVVVPIPKKVMSVVKLGDTRGIALLPTLTKAIAKVVAQRVNCMAEKHGLLAKEQAGFRTMEECTAQAATLYEIVSRRSIRNQRTYIAFIDYAKAYDKVPQAALIRKLESIGIGGHLLKIIKALYDDPRMCVRLGSSLSPIVNYHCGVRQGCPASPILFDLFINDLLDNIEGVYVPDNADLISGLLFADDAVLLAEDERALQNALDSLTDWSNKHEMRVNASKCGIMMIKGQAERAEEAGSSVSEERIKRPKGEASPPNEPFKVMGEEVPMVDEYIYLGIRFTSDLGLHSMMKHCVSKGRKALGAMYHLLTRRDYPVFIKILAIKAKLQPIVTYGAEVWGMASSRTTDIQKIVDEACRRVMKGGRASCMKRIRAELGIQTCANIGAVKRSRALVKWRNSKTWISTLLRSEFKSRRWTWVSGAIRWTQRYVRTEDGRGLTKGEVNDLFTLREEDKKSKVGAWAADLRLNKDPVWIRLGVRYPELQRGCLALGRIRSGTFNLMPNLANKRIVDSRFRSFCPFCETKVSETITHLFFICPRWDEYRDLHFKWGSTGASQYIKNLATNTPVVWQALTRVLLGEEMGSEILSILGLSDENSGGKEQFGIDTFVLPAVRYLQRIIPLREGMIQRIISGDRRFSWSQCPLDTAELVAP